GGMCPIEVHGRQSLANEAQVPENNGISSENGRQHRSIGTECQLTRIQWLRHFEGGQLLQRRRVEELNQVSIASHRQNPTVRTVAGLTEPPCGVLRELCLTDPA